MNIGEGSASKLVIHFPPQLWLGNFSRKYPTLQIRITAFVPVHQDPFIGNSLIEVSGSRVREILPFLDSQPSLLSYSIMSESQTSITLKTETMDQFLLYSIVKNGILISLPVQVSDGSAEFNIKGSREDINAFIGTLEKKGIQVDIKMLTSFSSNPIQELLTPKQYEVYLQARASGYYDSPRKLSLTELAEKLEVAKSSLSGMMQRIHNKLLG